jgi:phenylacetate-CoA ligase
MSVLAETALSTQLDYVLTRSAFYRAKFAGAHRVSTRAELAALPFMEKDELRASQQEFPPFGNYLAAAPAQITRVHKPWARPAAPSILP